MAVVRSRTDRGIYGAARPPPATMDQDELHTHLSEAVSGARRSGRLGLTAKLISYCWPGGPQDRYVPVGVVWLREWGPRLFDPSPIVSVVARRPWLWRRALRSRRGDG